MKPSIFAKAIFASAVCSSGVLATRLKRRADEVAILMYHRVLPREEAGRLGVQSGMFVQPDTFENHLRFLSAGFEILPLRDFPGRTRAGGVGGKPRCVLTFDDGWNDFPLRAFPLLQKYQVPATVFLPTDFVGSAARFWTDRFVALFDNLGAGGKRRGRSGDALVDRLIALTGDRESRIEGAIRILKGLRADEVERILSGIGRVCGVDPVLSPHPDFLSWDEVRRMAASGLVAFGSHTATHRILTALSPGEIGEELDRSRRRLLEEKVVDPSFIPFCYPNGDHDAGIATMVRETGFHLAVTTDGGWNGTGADLFSLRRIGIHEDMTRTRALFGCRIAGIL